MSILNVEGIYKKFGRTEVLKGVSFSMEQGEVLSILGSSGSGKTTLLRCINFLERADSGKITVDGEVIFDATDNKKHSNAEIRKAQLNFGMVFQSYALFPHLTVKENIGFGLKLRKEKKEVIETKVQAILESTDLSDYAERYPKQLSGGQRQRVALARALVIEPQLLLLDEPLSNLDAKLRISMRIEIKRIQRRLGITTVFVTHDQEECFSISDKVAVMNNGVIEQYDSPEEIYKNPKTEFVARFIGFENFFALTKQDTHFYTTSDGTLIETLRPADRQQATGTIRPDDILLSADGQEVPSNSLAGTIRVRTFLGKSYQYEVETAIGKLLVNDVRVPGYQVGDNIFVVIPKEKLILV